MSWEVHVKRNIPFGELEKLQTETRDRVSQNKSLKALIISEPTPTYTYGRNAKASDLLWTKERLEANGAQVFPVTRGGHWTYHGPGQIVVYPILHLPTNGFYRLGVREFMDTLRESTQQALSALGVFTKTGDNPFGIYIEEAKLASFGLAFSKGISCHGLALYIAPQHDRFRAIHPCGVLEGKMVSLQELRPGITWEDAASTLTEFLKIGFKSP